MQRDAVSRNKEAAAIPPTPSPVRVAPKAVVLDAKKATVASSSRKPVESNFTVPQATGDLQPINHQEEQRELMEETPQQNEDNYNLFTKNGNRRSVNYVPTLSVIGKAPEQKVGWVGYG